MRAVRQPTVLIVLDGVRPDRCGNVAETCGSKSGDENNFDVFWLSGGAKCERADDHDEDRAEAGEDGEASRGSVAVAECGRCDSAGWGWEGGPVDRNAISVERAEVEGRHVKC